MHENSLRKLRLSNSRYTFFRTSCVIVVFIVVLPLRDRYCFKSQKTCLGTAVYSKRHTIELITRTISERALCVCTKKVSETVFYCKIE